MKVSIIIPNYNGERYIKDCLDSLSKQSFNNFDITVVDNNSQDNSINLIRTFYPKIKLIHNNKNYGFSKAVNIGIKNSTSKYIVLLNNDTVVDNNWLENLVKCIEKDNKIFSVCSKMVQYIDRKKIDDAGDEYTLLGWAHKRGDGASVDKFTRDSRVFSACAGAAIYRSDLFEEIGYFDEKFFAYLEDVDISYRANIHGYKNFYCSNAIVYHIGSATSGSKHNSFKVRLAARNNIYVIYKNMPIVQFIINAIFILIGVIFKQIYMIRNGYGKDYYKGIIEGVKTIKQIDKVQYNNNNLKNYIKIQWMIMLNTMKLLLKVDDK